MIIQSALTSHILLSQETVSRIITGLHRGRILIQVLPPLNVYTKSANACIHYQQAILQHSITVFAWVPSFITVMSVQYSVSQLAQLVTSDPVIMGFLTCKIPFTTDDKLVINW